MDASKNLSLGRILVVDDDDWILSGVSVVLTAAGFEVFSACDGKQGLNAAFERTPDLIITDIVMPEMDGWTFLRMLRANPEFALVPVLFQSAKGGAQDRIAGFQLGADDYLGKPVNLPELPRRVLKALAHRRKLEAELSLSTPTIPGGKGLNGTLDQIGMATLLNVLNLGRRSGILRLTGGMLGEEALIYLVRGEIFRVEVQGKGRLTGDDALQQLFHRLEGGFAFTPMALRLPNEVNISTTKLLLRGAQHCAVA